MLLLPAKQRHGQAGLDELVAVDGGRNGADDALTNGRVFGQCVDGGLVLICEAVYGEEVFLLGHVVGLYVGAEDREAVLDVEASVIAVHVHTCDVHLLSWSCTVNEVMQQDDLLVAGQAAGRHSAGALLQSQLLEVAVDGLGAVHHEGALGAAVGAGVGLDLLLPGLCEGAQHVATLGAVVLDHPELGEHPGAAGHHTRHPHEAVQVVVP
mmetsp:Transcript_39132/g.87066  ORF Transcript_39132/g.87066 Transcript_39132/m.87066 type:complete len:210 (+) Transcript_39132:1212-1841(+)